MLTTCLQTIMSNLLFSSDDVSQVKKLCFIIFIFLKPLLHNLYSNYLFIIFVQNRESASRLVKSRIGTRPLLRTMLNHLKCTFEANASLKVLQELLIDYLVSHMAKASRLSGNNLLISLLENY